MKKNSIDVSAVASTSEETTAQSLRITEIFYSLQGESLSVGVPTVFVRLTGCPLRCGYCDTSYAFQGGETCTITDILENVAQYDTAYVCITGGEPLAQKAVLPLMTLLCDRGYQVSLETSGALDISQVDTRVSRVMDIKTPASKESHKQNWGNIDRLTEGDQVKFVICDRDDYIWACETIRKYELQGRCEILFSPAFEQLNATELAEWILQDQLKVRFQLQLHKILWGDAQGK